MPDVERSYRIVHVEDSLDDAELIERALRKASFKYSHVRVETEPDYHAQFEEAPPDVVLCESNLARMSAIRALEIIRERGLDLPFVVVSHQSDESLIVSVMSRGASDYLSKRNLDRLAEAIESAIERTAARREQARAFETLRASEAMSRAVFDSLAGATAVLDARGVILATNRQWVRFDKAWIAMGLPAARLDTNYLELLSILAQEHGAYAAPVSAAIKQVLAGEIASACLDYRLTRGGSSRVYLASVVPLQGLEGVVVSHTEVTGCTLTHLGH